MPTPRSSNKNLVVGIALIALVVCLGTTGYVGAGWNIGDAVYMVVIARSGRSAEVELFRSS